MTTIRGPAPGGISTRTPLRPDTEKSIKGSNEPARTRELEAPRAAPASTGYFEHSFFESVGRASHELNLNPEAGGGPPLHELISGMLEELLPDALEGQFEASAAVFKTEGSFGDPNGPIYGRGRLSVLEAAVRGHGGLGVEDGALVARGELAAQATLVDAEGELRANVLGLAQAQAQGEAYAGAKANVHGELLVDPARGSCDIAVGGDAFVGARAGVSGKVDLGGIGGVGVQAEAWAGLGITAKGEIGLKNGNLRAQLDYGAALGIGGKYSIDVNIDLNQITKAATDIVNAPGEVAKAVGSAVDNIFKGIFK